MRHDATKVDLCLIRRKVYHKSCGALLRWVPFPRRNPMELPGEAQYQCVRCFDNEKGTGFWKYRVLEKWSPEEFAARFETDDEDTV